MDEMLFDTIQIPRELVLDAEPAGAVSRHQLALIAAVDGGHYEAYDREEALERVFAGSFESLL